LDELAGLRPPPAEAGQGRLPRFRGRIIRRSDDQKGFETLPRHWVVERTFGWIIRWRRLIRDYEKRIDVSHAMILVATGGNLLLRNAHP
jgi:transposase